MNRYCVGPAMAVDWGEDELAAADRRRMTARILGYFRPYWRPGLLVVACIAVQAVPGLQARATDLAGRTQPERGGKRASAVGRCVDCRILVSPFAHLADGMPSGAGTRGSGLVARLEPGHPRGGLSRHSRPATARLGTAAIRASPGAYIGHS